MIRPYDTLPEMMPLCKKAFPRLPGVDTPRPRQARPFRNNHLGCARKDSVLRCFSTLPLAPRQSAPELVIGMLCTVQASRLFTQHSLRFLAVHAHVSRLSHSGCCLTYARKFTCATDTNKERCVYFEILA